ncbi:MAG: baseplate J/gp47 family protein [Lachnospiraceae bacterium]|nr:baseplate J/gp47 family protein [Lachnospiraceae bacterium]
MLPIEEVEQPDFLDLLEAAKEKISKYYPAWTNFNPADSGMAILELLAYMTELQQYHAGQLGPSHWLAFLHLLGIVPRGLEPAGVWAEAEQVGASFHLLSGTKFYVGTQIWETEKTVYMETQPLLSKMEKTPFYPFGEKPEPVVWYELSLAGTLKEGYVYTLYFDVDDSYPVKRNPIEQEEFLPLIRLSLEYGTPKGYRSCELLEDTTYGLLQSGYLQFRLQTPQKINTVSAWMPPDGKAREQYSLIFAAEGEYDTAPHINHMSFQMVPLVQKDTRVETREYKVISGSQRELDQVSASESVFYKIVCDTAIGVNGSVEFYEQTHKGFQRLRGYSSYLFEGRRYFVFVEIQAETIMMLAMAEGVSKESLTFWGSGAPDQLYYLPDKNVLGSAFSLWVEEEPDYYMPWHSVTDFQAAGEGERCFILEEKTGILRFGDGVLGRAPKGKIMITGYALCVGSAGNIQKKQILEIPGQREGCRLRNEKPGCGGADAETLKDCINRYQEEAKRQRRGVTMEDYACLIRETPGLRIKKVRVYPGEVGKNCLEAVVQPYTNDERRLRGGRYRENIMHYMEKHRLLGTKLLIRFPQYISITLQLEIAVKRHFSNVCQQLEAAVRDYFDKHVDLGQPVIYSNLYGYMEALPVTAGIKELSIYASGRGVVKEKNGDITIPPYGIPCLEKLRLKYVLES